MSSLPSHPTGRSDAFEIVDLSSHVRIAGRVADALPPGSPATWRRLTYRTVLSAVVRDRVENDTGDLEDGDETSLTDFVRAAAEAASVAEQEHRDDAYEIVLQGLLQDWVDNWNESDLEEEEDEEDAGHE
jgi:hypothetical protein